MILNRFKKRVRRLVVVTGLILLAGSVQTPSTAANTFAPMTAYAAEQQVSVGMSARWEDCGNHIWKVKTKDGKGYIKNTWFQDDVTGEWYLLGSDGVMYAGLITDSATGKTYLLDVERVGYYGRMLHTDGVYTINGKNIYLSFNQNHDGTFGAITSGLENLKNIAGLQAKTLSNIPMDMVNGSSTAANQNKQTEKGTVSKEAVQAAKSEYYLQLFKDIQSGKTSASSIPDADYKLALEAGNKAGLTANSNSTTTSKQSQAENDLPADIAAAAQNMRTQLRAQGCSESEIQSRVNSFIRTRLNSGIGTGRANNDFGYIR